MKRHIEYNKTVRYCEKLEQEGKAVILRPEYPIESLEKDIDVLNRHMIWGIVSQKNRLTESENYFKEIF
ncbi:MAG: DUF6363 domain-containing protein [Anaerostipes hadrus]